MVGPNKGNQIRRDRRREVGVEGNGEGGREARTSGQVDVVFGVGQWPVAWVPEAARDQRWRILTKSGVHHVLTITMWLDQHQTLLAGYDTLLVASLRVENWSSE